MHSRHTKTVVTKGQRIDADNRKVDDWQARVRIRKTWLEFKDWRTNTIADTGETACD
jgi:hypothetical protein